MYKRANDIRTGPSGLFHPQGARWGPRIAHFISTFYPHRLQSMEILHPRQPPQVIGTSPLPLGKRILKQLSGKSNVRIFHSLLGHMPQGTSLDRMSSLTSYFSPFCSISNSLRKRSCLRLDITSDLSMRLSTTQRDNGTGPPSPQVTM